ncbi:hypothetical protein C6503_22350 [Candidatus Poribacteria bacterium]|nr:MAG: hypothetical protein C6503_22350 [Candidatus Poribacteria bacterium]
MKLSTVEAKKRPSFNYIEYFETQLYYQCITCSTVVEPEMGYCRECNAELNPNNRQQLFCYECRKPIIYKRDYFINKKHFVSHYPVNYLACQCPGNLWIPFIKNQNFSDPATGLVRITVDNMYIWTICCAESSRYSNNEDIYFINCQQQEDDLFLKPYIRYNIGKTKLSTSERNEFTGRYYRICTDVISLGIKLGILRELMRDETFARRGWVRLENRIQEILDFSGIYFSNELISSLLENCFARLRRLFNPAPKDKENTVERYRNDFLKTSYPKTHKFERKKYGIAKLIGRLKILTNKSILHDDIDFNSNIFLGDCRTLFDFYDDTVLKTIDILNKMHRFKLFFNHEDSLRSLGLHNTGGEIALAYLRLGDEALTAYKQKQALELLRFDNYIDNGNLSPEERESYEKKRDIYERNLNSFFDRWIIWDHQTSLNIILPDGQHIEMPYGFKSMRLTKTHDGDYIIYIKTPGITLCPNYRIEYFGNNENFARQVFRVIDKQRYEHETIDLSNFTYDSSLTIF